MIVRERECLAWSLFRPISAEDLCNKLADRLEIFPPYYPLHNKAPPVTRYTADPPLSSYCCPGTEPPPSSARGEGAGGGGSARDQSELGLSAPITRAL